MALAAAAAPAEKVMERYVRFLPVGDSPPFMQEIRDGIRYEVDPPAGSLPPLKIVLGFGKEKASALSLHLGRVSAPVKIPGGAGVLDLHLSDAAAEAAPWHSLKRPESGDFLVYLFRSVRQKTWNEVSSLVIPDGPEAAPAGSLRIVNLYPLAVNVMWDGKQSTLAPGQNVLHQIEAGKDVPFQILVADGTGAMKRYYSSSVTQNSGERGLVTIYRADGEDPRRPVKVSMLREPVTVVSKDEKKPS